MAPNRPIGAFHTKEYSTAVFFIMEQPKDYEELIEKFDEAILEEYKKLPLPLKVVYKLQSHIFLTIVISVLLGYLAGIYFGDLSSVFQGFPGT